MTVHYIVTNVRSDDSRRRHVREKIGLLRAVQHGEMRNAGFGELVGAGHDRQPRSATIPSFTLHDFTSQAGEKFFYVTGNTFQTKDQLPAMGGKGSSYNGRFAWMFRAERREEVELFLDQVRQEAIQNAENRGFNVSGAVTE